MRSAMAASSSDSGCRRPIQGIQHECGGGQGKHAGSLQDVRAARRLQVQHDRFADGCGYVEPPHFGCAQPAVERRLVRVAAAALDPRPRDRAASGGRTPPAPPCLSGAPRPRRSAAAPRLKACVGLGPAVLRVIRAAPARRSQRDDPQVEGPAHVLHRPVDAPRIFLMLGGRRHQGDKPAHRVDEDPPADDMPVELRKLREWLPARNGSA